MKEFNLPTKIITEKTSFSFREIHQIFAESEYGSILSQEVRYERYKPQGVDNNKWEELLGVDVNNLKHLRLTYGLTRRFLYYCANPSSVWQEEVPEIACFTPKEAEALLLTAITHDWAEAIVGDKMFDLKTEADEQEEARVQQLLTVQLLGGLENNEIIQNRNSKLNQAFNAIERLSYLRTGLRAWSKSKDKIDKNIIRGLWWLTNNVLFNQIEKLIEYSQTYPPVRIYLVNMQQTISEAFKEMPASSFEDYDSREREAKKAQFEKAKKAWQLFIESY